MSQIVRCELSVSLDGFAAGPGQSEEEPLGRGGERLHDWVVATQAWQSAHGRDGGEQNADSEIVARMTENLGAHIMGRNMFGPVRGEWDREWNGWWGEEPPFHAPVFVLTHYAREPVAMAGGTTFHFVTDGIESALEQAREAAGGKDVAIAGGASTARQYLAAGLLDELMLHVAPVMLGSGERLLEDVGTPELEQIESLTSERVAHMRYRVVR